MIKKYGKPAVDRKIWDDDLYKDELSRHGFAVSIGHLSSAVKWGTTETEITMILSGENFNVNHLLYYESKFFKKKLEKLSEKEKLEEF